MQGKRRDKNGRILKTGESQRKDLTYMFRYNENGERKCVYAKTLQELRSKEEEIEKRKFEGLQYASANVLVKDYIEHYIEKMPNIKFTTKGTYMTAFNRIKNTPVGNMKVSDVKKHDAKLWASSLKEQGLSFNSINISLQVAKAAFETAVEDEIVSKNPFNFKLSTVIPIERTERSIIPLRKKDDFLEFVKQDRVGKKYYHDLVILIETGMRIGELYGLTKSDIDLEKKCIHVSHQIFFPRNKEEQRHIIPPKSKAGDRWIPMTGPVAASFKELVDLQRNRKVQVVIDGHSGFLFVDHSGYPRRGRTLNAALAVVIARYNEANHENIPVITAHALRHTFCSYMVSRGMDIKSLQYVVGHSKVGLLLDRYAHSDYEIIESAMLKEV